VFELGAGADELIETCEDAEAIEETVLHGATEPTENETKKTTIEDVRQAGRQRRPAVIVTGRRENKPGVREGLFSRRAVTITARDAGLSHALRSSSVFSVAPL